MSIDLDGLLEAVALKALPRAGWGQRGVSGAESVAAHSWGVSWLVLCLLPPHLSRERALSYAVLHDLPEVRVGDLTPADGVDKHDKAQREHHAMASLCAEAPHLLQLWTAYEAQADAEARFVRQLDRLDMAIQAVAYALAGHAGMAVFLDSAQAVVTEPVLCALLDDLRARLPS